MRNVDSNSWDVSPNFDPVILWINPRHSLRILYGITAKIINRKETLSYACSSALDVYWQQRLLFLLCCAHKLCVDSDTDNLSLWFSNNFKHTATCGICYQSLPLIILVELGLCGLWTWGSAGDLGPRDSATCWLLNSVDGKSGLTWFSSLAGM